MQLRAQGTGMILVSHSLGLIEETCERAMLLMGGECVTVGPSRAVTAAFRQRISAEAGAGIPGGEAKGGALKFVAGTLVNNAGRETAELTCGETANLDVLLSTEGEVRAGHFCVWVMRADDEQIAGVGYLEVGRDLPPIRSGTLRLRLPCRLMPGDYRLGVTFSLDGRYQLVDQFEPCSFTVLPRPNRPYLPSGVFELDLRAEGILGQDEQDCQDLQDFCESELVPS